VVSYLKSYSQEAALRQSPRPRGATAMDVAPVQPADAPPQQS
jgi:putative heme transporter